VKLLLIYVTCIGFALLGIVSFIEGNPKVGVATVCLATANALLLL
jgi:hypothetical protein